MKITDLPEQLEHFRYRVMQDALGEAASRQWLARAAAFEQARPGGYVYPADEYRHLPGCRKRSGCACPVIHRKGERKVDWPGEATPAQIAEGDRRCAARAKACRHRASLALGGEDA